MRDAWSRAICVLRQLTVSLAVLASIKPPNRMSDLERPSSTATEIQSIFLDYGADETSGSVEFSESECGFSLRSRWQFAVGTELALDCAWCDARLGTRRMSVAGVVVGCERCAENRFETTVFIFDLPEAARLTVHEFSFHARK